jgi:uncharacterized membrane protein
MTQFRSPRTVSRSSSGRQELRVVFRIYLILASGGALVGSAVQILLGSSPPLGLAVGASAALSCAVLLFKPWRIGQRL